MVGVTGSIPVAPTTISPIIPSRPRAERQALTAACLTRPDLELPTESRRVGSACAPLWPIGRRPRQSRLAALRAAAFGACRMKSGLAAITAPSTAAAFARARSSRSGDDVRGETLRLCPHARTWCNSPRAIAVGYEAAARGSDRRANAQVVAVSTSIQSVDRASPGRLFAPNQIRARARYEDRQHVWASAGRPTPRVAARRRRQLLWRRIAITDRRCNRSKRAGLDASALSGRPSAAYRSMEMKCVPYECRAGPPPPSSPSSRLIVFSIRCALCRRAHRTAARLFYGLPDGRIERSVGGAAGSFASLTNNPGATWDARRAACVGRRLWLARPSLLPCR